MKLHFSALIIAGLLLCQNAFPQSDTLISWNSEVKLNWDDFLGKPVENSAFHALTDWGMNFAYDYDGNQFNFSLGCTFSRYKSWVQPGKETDSLLMHEQLHFDIAELSARKMRKQITETDFTVKSLSKQANQIYSKHFEECSRLQRLYDKETMHSTNKIKQAEWEKSVKKELRSLAKFAKSAYSVEKKQSK